HRVHAPDGVEVTREGAAHATRLVADLAPGQWLRLELVVAYTAAAERGPDALRAEAESVLHDVAPHGWEALLDEHAAVLAGVWEHADVEVEGDDEMQQALRYAVLQVVQAAAGSADVGIRAKGLTGTGYDGHTFWDADTYLTPVLNHLLPAGAAAHLRWRHRTMPDAVDRARELGLAGAAFPWRTITGRESSGYWPAGTAAPHVTSDVADAAVRHAIATQDDAFTRDVALDLAVQAARMWVSLGRYGRDGGFHLDGVTGPDEYSALGDDNAFTNLMAARVLRWAARLAERFPDAADGAGVTPDEPAAWLHAATSMVVPYDDVLGVTEQHAGYTDLAVWDLAAMKPDDYPLHTTAHYSALYRHQVLKQADVVMAAYLVDDAFTLEQKRRDLEYYEPLTVRDSSLSAPPQAVVAAEVGYLDLAWAYARETALVDLRDDGRPTEDGVHVAAHAGAWTALVAGFGGLREGDDGLRLRPVLPPGLTRLAFGLRRGGSVVRVDVVRDAATYRLATGPEVELTHEDAPVRLTPDEPSVRLPISPRHAPGPAPLQPPGREPRG
ncbi:glycoside hydrolase family 65 protein, partial [Actinotalea ferrariae]|uniref:glycosyl hydrolase family 65 protein n=1 Tax=Actinotalea ferrariae TaxID=1386098 RepID=UPI001C8BE2A3